MKLMIDGYEVQITAKRVDGTPTKQDTMHFLNSISLLAGEAAERYNGLFGREGCAEWADQISRDIFDALEKKHFYD